MKALLVGAQYFSWPTISLGCLKASADADPELSGRVDVELLHFIRPTPERVAAEVAARRPDVLGFSCYLWNSGVFFDALPAIRAALPSCLIVVGGPDVHPRVESVLAERPEVDAVALGEGEVTFPRLLARRLSGGALREVPGLAFREEGRVVRTAEPPAPRELDVYPSPYLSGALSVGPEDVRVTIETSRGCPFDCSFCDWPGRRQKPRNFSVDRVIAELRQVVAQGENLMTVVFADADIFVDRERAKQLLTRAREVLEGTTVLLALEAYLGRLDDELVRLLDSTCFAIEGGVQTATPEALKTVNRFFHRDKIAAAAERLRRLAPRCRFWLQLIYALPGDTFDGFLDSLDWALSLRPHGVASYPALVLPGADMGLHPERYDMVFDPRPPRRIVATSRFPAESVRAATALSARVMAVSRLPFARQALYEAARGHEKRAHASLFDEYGRRLSAAGLLPPQERLESAEDPSWMGADAAKIILADPERLARAQAALREMGVDAAAQTG